MYLHYGRCYFALLGIFRDDHRLKHIALRELAVLATEPERLHGTFLHLAYVMRLHFFHRTMYKNVEPSLDFTGPEGRQRQVFLS